MKPQKLLFAFAIMLTIGCSKDNSTDTKTSEFINNFEGKHFKEIVVSDTSGKNSAYIRISANNSEDIFTYLETHALSLYSISHSERDTMLKSIENIKPNEDVSPETNKSTVVVEFVTLNRETEDCDFLLKVSENKQLNTKNTKSLTTYSSNSFIGAVHYGGSGSLTYVKRYYKLYNSNVWSDTYINIPYNGVKYLGPQFGSLYFSRESKFFVIISPTEVESVGLQVESSNLNNTYFLAFNREDYRGNNCSLGTWDSRNCYVGTAPNGTTAFMYPNNTGNFYYTPINGNQCPYPGSYFDSQNCFVANIPENQTYGFIWNNQWYVKGNKIPLTTP